MKCAQMSAMREKNRVGGKRKRTHTHTHTYKRSWSISGKILFVIGDRRYNRRRKVTRGSMVVSLYSLVCRMFYK